MLALTSGATVQSIFYMKTHTPQDAGREQRAMPTYSLNLRSLTLQSRSRIPFYVVIIPYDFPSSQSAVSAIIYCLFEDVINVNLSQKYPAP